MCDTGRFGHPEFDVTVGRPELGGSGMALVVMSVLEQRLDAVRAVLAGGFQTTSGKCELYSQALADRGLDPLPAYRPAAEGLAGDSLLAKRFPLLLLSAKTGHHFLNSSYANVDRALKAERPPRLDISAEDATSRGITDGDMVRAFNDRGSVAMMARVGDRVRPKVVSIPSGWWASLSPSSSSANALTADGLSDLGDGGNFHDTLVEVELVEKPTR